jgi:3-(3-hydroxy-phenyl)propionate hydroxylase
VLLAGDAAHQTPPFAGQGMCSGIRDAVNIAWKLGHVLRGEAGEMILDTYQTEREPHVRAFTESAIAMGRIVCTADPEMAAQRDAVMLAQRAQGQQPVPPPDPSPGPGLFMTGSARAGSIFPQGVVGGQRLDDILGSGAWLIVRSSREIAGVGSPVMSRIVGLDFDALAPFAPALSAWLDEARADAVLVRPDRYVFGTGDIRALLAAYEYALGG